MREREVGDKININKLKLKIDSYMMSVLEEHIFHTFITTTVTP